ncbi:hypothetical protein Salat_2500900 [Sesamum alatum]|uniref:Uncharacterized protein n=1 Tax=Sesamum alatum TaxID=300844 RepID=A0AAE1XRL1_9LAMI|nr:hypothetical protein Salat_2500900 [Sesamum alatum]
MNKTTLRFLLVFGTETQIRKAVILPLATGCVRPLLLFLEQIACIEFHGLVGENHRPSFVTGPTRSNFMASMIDRREASVFGHFMDAPENQQTTHTEHGIHIHRTPSNLTDTDAPIPNHTTLENIPQQTYSISQNTHHIAPNHNTTSITPIQQQPQICLTPSRAQSLTITTLQQIVDSVESPFTSAHSTLTNNPPKTLPESTVITSPTPRQFILPIQQRGTHKPLT